MIKHRKRVVHFAILGMIMLWGMNSANASRVTLKLKGADINAFIGTVADVTRKNFIVDPRVKGKVTIISSRSMDENEVYQVFLSVLEVHGFTAVPAGKVIKILPDADAKHSAIPAGSENSPGSGDEAVTRVIEIKHVTAAQLVPILRPLVPPQGHLAAYPPSNMLIFSDRASNIARLVNIIKRIDQPTSGEIEFIQLQHASSADVVRVLTSLQQQGKKQDPKSQIPILVADERSNSILVGGEKGERLQLRAIITHLDTPTEMEGDTHVVYLRFAKAKDLVPVLTGVQSTQKTTATKKGGRSSARTDSMFNIQADETTNALVITAPPGIFRTLQKVIQKLDVRREQVMVEAIIADIAENTSANVGIDWAAIDPTGKSGFPAVISNLGGGVGTAASTAVGIGALQSGNVNAATTAAGAGAASNAIPGGFLVGFGQFPSSGLNWGALISALKSDSTTNVLSTPTLLTMDNEEASILVGQEVPFITGSFTSTGGTSTSGNPFQTIKRESVGIELKVKPQINEGNTVKLEIEQKIDSIGGQIQGSADISTNKRSIKTTVMVDNGKILVLGGLIKDDIIQSETKIPWLGDIPLIGALFRHTSLTKIKTNLMVFLRPLILRDEKSGLKLTEQKYDYIRGAQKEFQDNGVAFMRDADAPLLPNFNEYLELPPSFEDTQKGKE